MRNELIFLEVVYDDDALIELASLKPKSLDELGRSIITRMPVRAELLLVFWRPYEPQGNLTMSNLITLIEVKPLNGNSALADMLRFIEGKIGRA